MAGVLGLLALTPTALLLAQGAVGPSEAAGRAVATLVGVMVIGRLAAWWLGAAAGEVERRSEAEAPRDSRAMRRGSDGVVPSGSPAADDQRMTPDAQRSE
jgi:hypothetical protein